LKTKLVIHPQARQDLDEIADYIFDQSPDFAIRFLDAAESSFEFILENPEAGAVSPFENVELSGMRRWRVSGFEIYLIFYLFRKSTVSVIRVLHGARDIELIFSHSDIPQ
jgi:toxin ParE1/3/4